jgi:hypothetical protein
LHLLSQKLGYCYQPLWSLEALVQEVAFLKNLLWFTGGPLGFRDDLFSAAG